MATTTIAVDTIGAVAVIDHSTAVATARLIHDVKSAAALAAETDLGTDPAVTIAFLAVVAHVPTRDDDFRCADLVNIDSTVGLGTSYNEGCT